MPNPESHQQSSPAISNRNQNWVIAEDEQLCRSWINVSLNAVVGTDQKNRTMWQRIHADIACHKITRIERNATGLAARWGVIQRSVSKFCGLLAQVEALQQSGTTFEDKVVKAHELYEVLNKGRFKFEHCWRILREVPRWAESVASALVSVESEDTADTFVSRPPGRKHSLNKLEAEANEKLEAFARRRAHLDALLSRRFDLDERRLALDAERHALDVRRSDFEIASADVSAAADPTSAAILQLLKKRVLLRLQQEGNDK